MIVLLLSAFACAPAPEGDPVAGEAVYADNCASCHGADGEGGSGPAMDEPAAELSEERIAEIALYGDGDMPAVEGLGEQDAADVAAYVVATWGP